MPAASRISARIGSIAESATLAVDAKAKSLKAAGEDVIGFGAGEPDFPTPDYIVDAAAEATRNPRYHRYSPAAGLPELREALAEKTTRDSGYRIGGEPLAAKNILVTNGGKQAVYNTFATLLDPGDEVIVPPLLDHLPGVHQAGRRSAGGGLRRAGTGLPGHRGPARGRAHRTYQGAALRLPLKPHRRGLLP